MQVGGVFRKRMKLVLFTFLLLICGAGGVKYKGVSIRNGRYCCSVRVPGMNYVLWVGTYETELEAARANDVVAHYLGKNRRGFNFNDYHPSLESVLEPFPSHLSFNRENKGAVTKFIASQVDGLLQDRRRLLRGDDVDVNVRHLQGVQMDQTLAHDELSLVQFLHLDWSQVSPGHADLNHVHVPEHDFPLRELDFDVDGQNFHEEVFLSEPCTGQQFCPADNIVNENEGGLGGQLRGVEQPDLQAASDHSWSLLPDTQMQPLLEYFAGSDQFLLSEPEGIVDVGNQNLERQDLMMLDPFGSGGAMAYPCDHIPNSQEDNDKTMDDLPMATDTACPLCASKKIATHLLSYQLHDPVGLLKTIVALFQGLKEAHMLDSTSDQGCEFPLCTSHQEENHGEGDESVPEQSNPARGIALPSSNDDPLSGLTQNIFMYVSSTRIHPVSLFKFILVMLSVLPYLLVRLSYKTQGFEGRGDMVVAPPLPTQTGCSYRPNQYLQWLGSSSTTPGMHPRDQWRYVIDRSSSARGEIRRNIEAWEISMLVEALKTSSTAKHREAAVKALINLSEVKELMGRFEEAEVIPSLLAILRDDTENWVIRDGSIITLFKLCENASMRKVMGDFGGVPSVIHLLRDESINLSLETEEKALFIFAFLVEETFVTIKKSSTTLDIAIPLLINKLHQRISGVQRGIAMCISVLARVPEYSCIFGNYGAIPILFESLKDRLELKKTEALVALQMLFNANMDKFNPCIATPILVEGLRELGNEMDRKIAAKLLDDLLNEMEENFVAIEKSGAVPALVNLLHDGPPLSKIFAANKLIDICSKHEHVTDIVSSGALIPPLITILQGGDTQEKERVVFCLFRLSMHVEYHQVIYTMVDSHAVELLLDVVRKNVAPLVTASAACILKLILPSAYAMDNTDLSSIILNTTLQAMNGGIMVEKEQVLTQFLLQLISAELNCGMALIQEWTPFIALLVNMPLNESTSTGKLVAASIFIALSEQDRYRAFVVNCGAIQALKCLLQTGKSSQEKEMAAMGLSVLFRHGEGMDEFVGSDGITYMIDIIRNEVLGAKMYALEAIRYLSKVNAYKVVIRQWSSFFLSLFITFIKDGAEDLIECVSHIVVNIFEGHSLCTEDFDHSDAFPIVLHELQHGAPNMRKIAATCLLRFTFIHELTASFGRSDVIPTLVNILRTRGLKENVKIGKVLIMLFVRDVKFQISIATLGALPFFVDLLKTAENPSDKVVASIFLYKFLQLGNGNNIIEGPESNIAFQIGDLPGHTPTSMEQFIQSKIEDIVTNQGIIPTLVNSLGDENYELQEFAAFCLSELACMDKYNLFIGDCYAIPPLVELLWNGLSYSSTKAAAATALFRLSNIYVNRDRLNMFDIIPALTNLMVAGDVTQKVIVVCILNYFFAFNDTCWNETIMVSLRNSIDAKNVLIDMIQNGDPEEYKQDVEELFNHVYMVRENNVISPILTPTPTVEVHEITREVTEFA